MTTIRATYHGDQALLTRVDLERLVALARQVENVTLEAADDDLSASALTIVSETGGAFDWLACEPDLYSLDDLKVRYS